MVEKINLIPVLLNELLYFNDILDFLFQIREAVENNNMDSINGKIPGRTLVKEVITKLSL